MKKGYKGKSKTEIPMPCLMAEDEHSQRAANGTAQKRESEKPLFTYAAITLFSLDFICAHH